MRVWREELKAVPAYWTACAFVTDSAASRRYRVRYADDLAECRGVAVHGPAHRPSVRAAHGQRNGPVCRALLAAIAIAWLPAACIRDGVSVARQSAVSVAEAQGSGASGPARGNARARRWARRSRNGSRSVGCRREIGRFMSASPAVESRSPARSVTSPSHLTRGETRSSSPSVKTEGFSSSLMAATVRRNETAGRAGKSVPLYAHDAIGR